MKIFYAEFDNGESFETSFNGSIDDAEKFYSETPQFDSEGKERTVVKIVDLT